MFIVYIFSRVHGAYASSFGKYLASLRLRILHDPIFSHRHWENYLLIAAPRLSMLFRCKKGSLLTHCGPTSPPRPTPVVPLSYRDCSQCVAFPNYLYSRNISPTCFGSTPSPLFPARYRSKSWATLMRSLYVAQRKSADSGKVSQMTTFSGVASASNTLDRLVRSADGDFPFWRNDGRRG